MLDPKSTQSCRKPEFLLAVLAPTLPNLGRIYFVVYVWSHQQSLLVYIYRGGEIETWGLSVRHDAGRFSKSGGHHAIPRQKLL